MAWALRRRRVPADEEEARWDFAFWSHNDLARFGDPAEDPGGAEPLELQRHGSSDLGRPLPVLLHGPVYDSSFAVAAREVNPPGPVDDFASWAERQPLEKPIGC